MEALLRHPQLGNKFYWDQSIIILRLNIMAHCLDEDSLIVDSGRTGGYQRILTETSIEMSPKMMNQRTRFVAEEIPSKIETERVHTEVVGAKVKNTFMYFKPPAKAIHSVAREKAKSQVSSAMMNQSTGPKQSKSRAIEPPRLKLFRPKESIKTQKDYQNRYDKFMFTPIRRQPKKYLDLTSSKTTVKRTQFSIEATTNQSLTKSILTEKSQNKISRLKIHALGKHLWPLNHNNMRNN